MVPCSKRIGHGRRAGERGAFRLAVAALYPDQTLEFQYVPRSADEMDDLVAEVVAAGLAELALSGIGPDIDSGGLLVEAHRVRREGGRQSHSRR
ncbi:MAG: hypothetical protein LBG60_05165 [Bifidobacteriaceae bacterium]|nr:hypothetical protein [Bifidobacteriaceae bacterium]